MRDWQHVGIQLYIIFTQASIRDISSIVIIISIII